MGDGRRAMSGPIRTLFVAGTVAGLDDGALIERFAAGGDLAESAFAALVTRHGPMVRRVCRAWLDDPNDAEDAFQATFLVLARKARGIRRPELLANWLYGTAHRASRKLRLQAARRREHEARGVSPARSSDVEGAASRREEAALVHEEVAKLPRACREAVVLCDLQGLARDEAALRLGCSDRTLRRRLSRARGLLRSRLTRRGLAPAVALLAPAPVSAGVGAASVDALARAVTRFEAGGTTAGIVPASAWTLAEGVSKAMIWTKLGGIALAMVVAMAVGAGVVAGVAAPREEPRPAPKAEAKPEAREPSPAEQYRALVERYQKARDACSKAIETTKTDAERQAIYERLLPSPEEYNPRFLALAERYPDDPAAVDALLWIVDLTLSSAEGWTVVSAETTGRAMTILARDHLGEPRLGPACLQLIHYPSPRRDTFLRAVAERSPDRVVRGRASLALALYLKMKGEFVAALKTPNPERKDDITLKMFGPDYLAGLREADPGPILRESGAVFARVLADFADVPYIALDGKPTRETLADVARRERERRPEPDGPRPSNRPDERFRAIDDAFQAGTRAADKAEAEAREKEGGPGEAGLRAWFAAYPKWSETGAKMWRLAEENPRNPVAFDALIWLVEQEQGFFDVPKERDAVMAGVADVLIRDHLDEIAARLGDRNVSRALNLGEAFPARHRERIHRALFERGRDRETRGREGLALARYYKAEADFVESLARRGADPVRRPEVTKFEPAFLAELLKADDRAIRREAERVLDRVIAEYGDVRYVNGSVPTNQTLADVAGRELSEIRTLAVGMEAPEIVGEDVDGKPMRLSDFRGKVVLLDFGSHEHCGGCRLLYPRLRDVVERLRARPFVVLGINNNDRRDTLKEAVSKGEITWRCWWDAGQADGPGPITERWNIRGLPTFFLIDHRGVIRSKGDVHPADARTFDEAVERLLKAAEADGTRRAGA